MSDGSQSSLDCQLRPLRTEERALLRALLSTVWSAQETDRRLAHAEVLQMADGGMGSLLFVHPGPEKHRFGREVAAADYIDQDGTLVDITVNLDQEGELFEIDLWKVNFAPLLRYPAPEDLKIRRVSPQSIPTAVAS